jgi:hypothetical protein
MERSFTARFLRSFVRLLGSRDNGVYALLHWDAPAPSSSQTSALRKGEGASDNSGSARDGDAI